MDIHEAGVLPQSVRYFYTPSSFAERVFFYPTRIGHYFCDRNYHFSFRHETALLPSHRLHYMFFLIKNGSLDLQIDGSHFIASRDNLVLFDCKRPHEYFSLSDDFEFYWLIFDGSSSEFIYDEILKAHNGRHVFRASSLTRIQTALSRIITYAEIARHRDEQIVSQLIYSVLSEALVSPVYASDGIEAVMSSAVALMDNDARLSVGDVAASVGLSLSHFSRVFRFHTGYSPHEYITLCRVDRAKYMLASTDETVNNIAFEIGYNSAENFIRAFKKVVGVSPTIFRKHPI
ncbi:MAG: helix-turn-helix transcriptional regulator [Clostridia bacterium]|nr:helix-turn-helix transcriptional regulator [Clostridia bacterium]